MSSFTYAFLKSGLYRYNTQITAATNIGRNWQHVYILCFGDALTKNLSDTNVKTRLCKIRGKATEQLCLNKIGK